jgi:NAD(P)-dependent dehydrogenase (short-subunit alcohol dehydrogenase family)
MTVVPPPGTGPRLSGKTALVTGAGSGIGRAIARALVREGTEVIGAGRRSQPLEILAAEASGPGRFTPHVADLGREPEVLRLAGRVRETGALSILVNNAGIARYAPVAEITTPDWDEMMAVNLRAPFLLVRELLPSMLREGAGHVVMVGSVAGGKAFAGAGAYGASKAGLAGFTRVLREETRGTGVRVTLVLPGATGTPIWGKDPPDPGRLMPAEAVADAVLFAVLSHPASVPEEVLLRPSRGDL